MLDYASLAALAAVLREGGFERAAAVLGVTPSAVSQRVRALEERLGAVLVVRGQPPAPTEAGAILYAHAERVRLLEGELAAVLPAIGASQPMLRIAVNADSLATWFLPAAARFAERSGALLDLVTEDEGHTARRLRSGEVLAAVTADPVPVQGCRTVPLGAMRYAAVASPGYLRRHFPQGVDAAALAHAPLLRFDRRDGLQARWAQAALGLAGLDAPAHWVPSSQGFVDGALAGLGWGMNPLPLVEEHLRAGRLVELLPGRRLDVALHWQHARLGARLLEALTAEVVAAARASLPQAPAATPPRGERRG
ncbi:ArgP/LysG family DNA-binding transcriptional regulator [Paracraurococcus ruber]|uniref:ArgP/LysG family DNA-binding transcriptional regulator n=2 Tax=Paracraurococcus ruber TaxID=77675 RepID=A0ABS1D4H8_9PROT|nr:LysR family transcriptional regulator ArgP [Paracraurococcus ruber]MBK1661752.1 ArgP/LysG family DNA-binding transcriptional regulator [Paracraurococcus ruber]